MCNSMRCAHRPIARTPSVPAASLLALALQAPRRKRPLRELRETLILQSPSSSDGHCAARGAKRPTQRIALGSRELARRLVRPDHVQKRCLEWCAAAAVGICMRANSSTWERDLAMGAVRTVNVCAALRASTCHNLYVIPSGPGAVRGGCSSTRSIASAFGSRNWRIRHRRARCRNHASMRCKFPSCA